VGRYRQPGEFEPHEGTAIAWPCRTEIYPGPLMDEARDAHAALAQAIAAYEPVWVIANPADVTDAERRCGPDIEVVALPIDDSWFRDTGPIYVLDGTERLALDPEFDGWGRKFAPWDRDAAVAAAWCEARDHARRPLSFVFEGGSLTVDGAGTGVTTAQCLLHPNRNPSLTQAEIERSVCEAFGLDVLVWMPYGLALDDDTDGHVDNVAAFAAPGRLLVQGCDDPGEDDHVRLNVARRAAEGQIDARGEAIEVVEVPVLPFVERDGLRVAAPYLNLYVGNGFVVVPTAGHPADDEMVALIGDQFPGRRTFALEVGSILAVGGGGIHCITQQIPSVPPA
jgi:agmatine deiminase